MLKPVPAFLVALSCAMSALIACSSSDPPHPPSNDGGSAPTAGSSAAGLGGAPGTSGAGGSLTGGAGASAAGTGTGTGGATGGGRGGSSAGGPSAGGGAGGASGAGPAGGNAGTAAATMGGRGGGGAAGSSGTLPPLHVEGPSILDPNGKKIVLRGFDLPDLGTLYADGGNAASAITDRIDKTLAAGLTAHVVRLAVYPRTTFNSGFPFYSPAPFPVGQAAPSGMHQTLSVDDYLSKILRPTVDYLAQKHIYAIIDYHQIDSAVGQSGADAVTFWQAVAPAFATYPNVIFEPFNEPIDTMVAWATFKTTAQSFVDTIRTSAVDNLIVVPSMNWDQRPGDAATSPPTGTNLVFTAHVYPGNWNDSFKQQVATAVALSPVFFTEWGYVQNGTDMNLGTADANWGPDFRTLVDANGASFSAWVADGSWTPNLFADKGLSSLSEFGTFTATWLQSTATSDWVE